MWMKLLWYARALAVKSIAPCYCYTMVLIPTDTDLGKKDLYTGFLASCPRKWSLSHLHLSQWGLILNCVLVACAQKFVALQPIGSHYLKPEQRHLEEQCSGTISWQSRCF